MKPWPTREEIERAVQAERDAEDAIAASVFTERQLNIFRALACLPEKLPDGPIETWNIKFDPNAPISAWRLALYPHMRHRADSYAPDDSDDAPKPASALAHPSGARGALPRSPHHASNAPTTAGPTGTPSGNQHPKIGNAPGNPGNKIGNPGNDSGKQSGNRAASHPSLTSPHSNLRNRMPGSGQVLRRAAPIACRAPAAVSTAGSPPTGNPGNPGNKIGNESGNTSGNSGNESG